MWRWWLQKNIFQLKSVKSTVLRHSQLQWISLHKKDSIDAEVFWQRQSEEERSVAWSEKSIQQVAKCVQFCEDSVRSLHKPFDFLIWVINLQPSCVADSKQRIFEYFQLLSHT